ncbi:uncharacterized protein K489DRAFT_408363 [Dissoconium aciculare CBS 342.82]|uniref:Uncharacterized protein n=1 Tax=Dissoconium aciculare CBS 342.82 TaxID=1314786 RepID=A0A6J3M7D6_9PEZI|nr:uncharacterized protein K489DRAFT_408363 [Dissoconium aciculare CBS 342.82]KAF1823920.1 hypothetical protein K489DRAFT_408363 [Dissoconium aciculare CBS 342.82]
MHHFIYVQTILGALASAVSGRALNVSTTKPPANASIVHFESADLTGDWAVHAPSDFLQLYPHLESDLSNFKTTQRVTAAGGTNGGLPGVDYNANQQRYSATLVNGLKLVGYIGGNAGQWQRLYYACRDGGGEEIPYNTCVEDVGNEVAALTAFALASSNVGNLAVVAIHKAFINLRTFTAAQDQQNSRNRKGNDDNGRDELKVRATGPDSCDGTNVYAALTKETYDPDHTYKNTMRLYCEGLPSEQGEAAASAIADAWVRMGYGQRNAYTVYDTVTGRVAVRGVIDIIPPYENPLECPAEIPGDLDGCTCVNC